MYYSSTSNLGSNDTKSGTVPYRYGPLWVRYLLGRGCHSCCISFESPSPAKYHTENRLKNEPEIRKLWLKMRIGKWGCIVSRTSLVIILFILIYFSSGFQDHTYLGKGFRMVYNMNRFPENFRFRPVPIRSYQVQYLKFFQMTPDKL